MAADMKELIAGAACRLLFEKKAKKLTIKDIVEECHITRQTFYYHFEDIPDLLRWILKRSTDRLLEECLEKGNGEEGLRYLFSMALSLRPYIKQGMRSNYGEEFRALLTDAFYRFAEQMAERKNLYQTLNRADLNLVLRYHSLAVMGLMDGWSPEDSKNFDRIVHEVYLLMSGQIDPFAGRPAE